MSEISDLQEKKETKRWMIFGIFFVAVLGTLWHFGYEGTLNAAFAPFCPVNCSTWEHQKMILFPMLLFTIIRWIVRKPRSKNWIMASALATWVGIITVIVLFYLYRIFMEDKLFMDCLIFYIAIVVAFIAEYYLQKALPDKRWIKIAGIVIFIASAVLFIVFTYKAPHIFLMEDVKDHFYGIEW